MVRGSITTSLEFVVRNWFGLCQGGESSYLFGVGHRSWLHFSLCVRRWVFLFVSGPKVALFQFIVEIIFVLCRGFTMTWLTLCYRNWLDFLDAVSKGLCFCSPAENDLVLVYRSKTTWLQFEVRIWHRFWVRSGNYLFLMCRSTDVAFARKSMDMAFTWVVEMNLIGLGHRTRVTIAVEYSTSLSHNICMSKPNPWEKYWKKRSTS